MGLSIDKENVISSLDNALVQMHGCGRYTPEDVDELETAAWKALELLKEQEPQKVINLHANWNSVLMGNCPKCNAVLHEFDNAKTCGICGQAVKWNET